MEDDELLLATCRYFLQVLLFANRKSGANESYTLSCLSLYNFVNLSNRHASDIRLLNLTP